MASAATLHGHVVSIADGDTLTILDAQYEQHRIRLQGIDAPESAQAFGKVSKHNLSSLVAGREVTVEYQKLDRYGRVVGKVTVDGVDLDLEQVRAGLAWVYTDYEGELSQDDRIAYRTAEREARRLRLGLWADNTPTPPWVFRRRGREARSNVPKRLAAGNASPVLPPGAIIGNRRSHIFHRPDCPDYLKVSPTNRVLFATASEAEAAGYREARNCP